MPEEFTDLEKQLLSESPADAGVVLEDAEPNGGAAPDAGPAGGDRAVGEEGTGG